MSARAARFALVTAVTATSALLAATGPARAQETTGGCADRPAAEPVAEVPWSQRRYAPERLNPLATGSGVIVAVIDSGVDGDHAQLRGRVLAGRDYLDEGRDGTLDCVGHGTAVASIVAAASRAGIGFHGLAPGALILPVRVSEQLVIDGERSGRSVTPAGLAEAIRWSVGRGAGVLNLSVVLYRDDPDVRAAIADAIERDVVVVAAAGNLHDKGDPVPYPAAYPGVLGVAAIGRDGLRAPFSQIGPYVDIAAPGGAVLAAAPGRGHRTRDGTSYAVPFVSATAALIRQYRPELPAGRVVDRILATADPAPGGDPGAYGGGILNPYRAVTETTPADPNPPPLAAPDRRDAVAAATRDRRAWARERALLLTGIAGGGAALTVLLAVVLPRGARRRWRPAEPV
nr:type VII secretion-associated serine protease mycosin [Micromonospora sp. DSM 115978]